MGKAKTRSSIELEISPFAQNVIESVVGSSVKKSERKRKSYGVEVVKEDMETSPTLVKSVLNLLNGGKNDSIERLAFETDPRQNNTYQSLYRAKVKLLPDVLLKRIAIQDDLVAAIVNARASQLSAFGRPRENRHDLGFVVEPKPGVLDDCDEKQKMELQNRIDAVVERIKTCGDTRGWDDEDRITFSQYLSMSARNAVVVGRIATEVIYVVDAASGERRVHSFRPIDAGTIYRAVPQKQAAQAVREEALHLLEQVKAKKLEPERFMADEYAWVQVVDGTVEQVFTSQECLVHNFYPVTDIELDGYPLTPIDTMISAVTTHINIVTHNKLYFQSGRASRGMLLIKSDDMSDDVIARIRQQFNASINSVANAWRMPVFGVGAEDEIVWQPIDNGGRDMEFQFLSDSNARVILSAFQMSPEELPGYAHLSRGTNNQALSESNQEYKLEAHRDVGIRPLIKNFEDFLNARILPLLDPNLAKLCTLRLVGLDAETAEKESVRIQQDMAVHMTMDEILEAVEKDPIGKRFGGNFLLNPQWQAIIDKYMPVGVIVEQFFGVQGASQDPQLQYYRDPFWFQAQQMRMQQQMAAQQQQQPQPQGGDEGGPGGSSGGDNGGGAPPPQEQQEQQQEGGELTRSLDQAISLLTKSEKQLPPGKKKLLAQHKATVDKFVKGWEKDIEEATKSILKVAGVYAKK
jgi:hypothetical protein